jgi:hypothetical protein
MKQKKTQNIRRFLSYLSCCLDLHPRVKHIETLIDVLQLCTKQIKNIYTDFLYIII